MLRSLWGRGLILFKFNFQSIKLRSLFISNRTLLFRANSVIENVYAFEGSHINIGNSSIHLNITSYFENYGYNFISYGVLNLLSTCKTLIAFRLMVTSANITNFGFLNAAATLQLSGSPLFLNAEGKQ